MDMAPVCIEQVVTQAQAAGAVSALRKNLPNTSVSSAAPSEAPGLIKLGLPNGQYAYTDKDGRYLIVGVVIDAKTGKALDGVLDGVASGDANKENLK